MKTKYKHIHFVRVDAHHWNCLNNKTGGVLCEIYHYAPWRKYVFEGQGGCVFDTSCLQDILHFMGQLKD